MAILTDSSGASFKVDVAGHEAAFHLVGVLSILRPTSAFVSKSVSDVIACSPLSLTCFQAHGLLVSCAGLGRGAGSSPQAPQLNACYRLCLTGHASESRHVHVILDCSALSCCSSSSDLGRETAPIACAFVCSLQHHRTLLAAYIFGGLYESLMAGSRSIRSLR